MALRKGSIELRGRVDFITPFVIATSLFFIWGFVTNFNGVLEPHLKKACSITDTQAQLLGFTFFTAYLVMAIPAGLLIKKVGYRRSMIIGLGISTIGTVLFYPAALDRSFALFLSGLAIMASGITILQVGANMYIIQLGPTKYASSRLCLAGAFNSVGASIAPYIGSLMVLDLGYLSGGDYQGWLEKLNESELQQHLKTEANTVLEPYAIIAGMLLLTCLLFMLARIPSLQHTLSKKKFNFSIIKRRHVFLGTLAIFFYVGAEVGVLVHLGDYAELDTVLGTGASRYLSLGSYFMFLAMIGRFVGSIITLKMKPRKLLVYSSSGAILCLIASMLTNGWLSLVLLVGVGLFNSVMWPLIFVLGTRALRKHSIEASSFLVMAIVGGALIPFGITWCFKVLRGTGFEQFSFAGIVLCYFYLLHYGARGSAVRLIR